MCFSINRVCARDVSKSEEPLKVLSSLCIKGNISISVYNLTAQCCHSFGNQLILNYNFMVVRDIKLTSRLLKNIHLSHDF